MQERIMSTRKKLVAACLLGFVLCFAGCNADGGGPTLSKTEALRLTLSPEVGKFMNRSEIAFQQGNHNLAMTYLDSAKAIEPDLADVYFMRGRIFAQMNRWEQSQIAYQNVLARDEAYKGAYHNMGVNFFRRGLFRQAVAAYRAEEEIEPTTQLYLELGKTYAKLGEPDSARIAYERSIELDANNPTAFMWLGQLMEETGELEKALEYSLQGAALKPEDPDYAYIIGTLYNRMGETDKAIEYLEPVAEAQPWHQGAQYNLGQALLRLGKQDEAQFYLAQADSAQQLQQAINEAENGINSEPDNPIAWITLANLLWQSKQYDKAIDSYQNGITMDPGNLAMQNNLANMLVEAGRLEEGIQQYQRILNFQPEAIEVWINLGAVLANNKRYEEARFAWETALDRDPDNASVKSYLRQLETLEAES